MGKGTQGSFYYSKGVIGEYRGISQISGEVTLSVLCYRSY